MVLLCAVVLVALVTYDPADLPSEQFPANPLAANWAGYAGARVAHLGYQWFGIVIFPLIGLIGYWAVAGAACGHLKKKGIRLAGLVLLAASLCAFTEALPINPRWISGIPGPGGVLGKLPGTFLLPMLGTRGFLAVFGCLSFLSLCLATDARLAAATASGLWRLAAATASRLWRMARKGMGLTGSSLETAPQPEPMPELPVAPIEEPLETIEEEDPPAGVVVKKKPKKKLESEPKERKSSPVDSSGYRLPGVELLTKAEATNEGDMSASLREESEILCKTLSEFGINAEVVNIEIGPVIVQYQLELAAGTKVHKVMALSDDLAMALKTPSVRIVAPIPGKSAVGIEVPNKKRNIVRIRELFEALQAEGKRCEIPLLLGKDCSGKPVVLDLTEMPHLLIAGATGAGKTVCLNTLIMGMLMTRYPKDLKLLLVDPKMVEMAMFKDIPHLISPVVTDMKKAPTVLAWAAVKMDERYDVLAEAGVRSIVDYNAVGAEELRKRSGRDLPDHLPYIVIIIDELADLMSTSAKEVETSITRLAQKSRAVGIHIVLATQRPSVDVITGLIKSNMPSRISFRVTSKIDSRTILDRNGAEKLLGQGDLLLLPPGSTDMLRVQGTYVSDSELRAVVNFIKAQAEPEYYEDLKEWSEGDDGSGGGDGESGDDSLYDDAVRIVVESQRGSASLLQRRLGIGYTRASRLIDIMEDTGVVGHHKEAQARKVLLTPEDLEQDNGDSGSQDDQPSS